MRYVAKAQLPFVYMPRTNSKQRICGEELSMRMLRRILRYLLRDD